MKKKICLLLFLLLPGIIYGASAKGEQNTQPDFSKSDVKGYFTQLSQGLIGIRGDNKITAVSAGSLFTVQSSNLIAHEGFNTAQQVYCGKAHTLVVTKDGKVLELKQEKGAEVLANEEEKAVQAGVGDGFIAALYENGEIKLQFDPNCGIKTELGAAEKWKDCSVIACGDNHILAVGQDNKVYSAGINDFGQRDIEKYKNIVSVAAGRAHSLLLESNGKVHAAGDSKNGQCDTSQWENIVAVDAYGDESVGLRSDGTVVYAGSDKNLAAGIQSWTDIVCVRVGRGMIVGINNHGTLKMAFSGEDTIYLHTGMAADRPGLFKQAQDNLNLYFHQLPQTQTLEDILSQGHIRAIAATVVALCFVAIVIFYIRSNKKKQKQSN